LRAEGEAISTTYIGSLYETETTGNGTPVTRKHIFMGSQRIATISLSQGGEGQGEGATSYYHSDHLGSSNIITNGIGNQVSRYEYTTYGSVSFPQSFSGNPGTSDVKYLFTGKELDNTGLYFYGARYYDPEIGRFITADPTIQRPYDPQDLNRYSYCRNNPLNLVDPSGLGWFKKFWQSIVGVASTIISILVPPLAPAMMAINFGISAYNAIQTGNIAGLAGGMIGGAVFGAIGKEIALGMSGAMGSSAFSFGGGALIGAVEFGAGGFGAGFGASLAGGESLKDSLKAGGMGAAAGAAMGAVIEGSYMAGWQNSLHGASRTEVYEGGIRRLHALSVNANDKTTAVMGSRPVEKYGVKWGRHRYVAGRIGHFEMGSDETTGLIEINGENSYDTTMDYLTNHRSDILETTVTASQSGFDRAVGYYKAAWEGQPYNFNNHNSNYAANTVIYGAGANIPGGLGFTPGFPHRQ